MVDEISIPKTKGFIFLIVFDACASDVATAVLDTSHHIIHVSQIHFFVQMILVSTYHAKPIPETNTTINHV